MWRRAVAYAFFPAVGVALNMAAVYLVLDLTHRIPEQAGALRHSLAISVALLLSIAGLFVATYISVRLAVLLFDGKRKQETP
jgi:hypothetical protein